MNFNALDKSIACIIGFYSLFLWFFGVYVTIFNSPDIDMGVFYERFADPNFLPNDFYTNAISTPNPRFIFGYFIGYLTKIFSCEWYKIYFFIKIFLVIFNPILAHQMIVSFFRNQSRDNLTLIKIISAVMIIYLLGDVYKYSVAFWPAIIFFVSAQTVSFLFGVIAIVILNNHSFQKKYSWLFNFGILFFIASTFLHPNVGLIFFIFYVIFNYAINDQIKLKQNLIYFLVIIVLPYLILYFSFTSKISLSAEKFIEIYVLHKLHFPHYLPSKFGSLTRDSWLVVFLKINFVFAIALLVGIFKKDFQIIKTALLSILIFCGSVILQYIGVELFKIKFIAILGPSRFLILGYWMAMLCIILLIVNNIKYLKKHKLIYNSKTKLLFDKISNLNIRKQKHLFLKTFAMFFFFNIVLYSITLDDPFAEFDKRSFGLFSWIKNNIEKDAIILTDHYSLTIPILAKRSSISPGFGFTFNEDFFEELSQRENLINQMKSLSKEQLQEFSKKFKFNYVIFFINDQHQLKKEKPVYKNAAFLIYKI